MAMDTPPGRDFATFAIVPARGGSKSIEHKNLLAFLGRPLVAHVIEAAKRSRQIDRVVCTTDDASIATLARELGAEVLERPRDLARDDTPILDVLRHHLPGLSARGRDVVVLLQPTSPFVLPEHIDACVDLLAAHPEADAAQTISSFPHNHHAYNQRVVEGGYVRFRFEKERLECYNKQLKPQFYAFGNLVATRASAIVDKGLVFGELCLAVEIPREYAVDIDGPDDVAPAVFLVESGRVKLPWL
jgi:CMP-N-acetylneuraminic acid synthetase